MQYPTIGQPQYGFAPTMPGMAGGGLASLPVRRFQDGGASTVPRYTYNPVTQRYTRITPEQQADLAMAAQNYDYGGGDSGFGSPGSPGSPGAPSAPSVAGSSGTLGGAAQSLGGAVAGIQSALGPFSMAVPGLSLAEAVSNMGQDKAMDVNEQVDAALAAANQQANQATVSQGLFGPQVTTAVDISPVTVNPVDVSPIAGLAAMNQAQKAEEETSPAAVAIDVAATVAATQDAVDAEGGQTIGVGVPSGVGTDTGAGGGGDSPGDPGNAPSIGGSMDAFGSNDSPPGGEGSEGASPSNKQGGLIKNYQYGGQVMNYEQGGLAAAQQAQSKGRGQDTMLVHMTPKEVGGLQALAMAHGGSLTINPQTGLPEAGFLSAILPMVAGFALGPAGFGLMSSALGAGAVVGGLTGLATGSLKKGLMAGLGAYGGFGLGEGLTAAATPMEAATTQVAQAPTSAFNLAQSNIDPSILESGLGAGSKESIMQQAMQSPAYQQALTSPQLGSSALDTMSAADVAQAKVLPGQMITTTPAIPAPAGFEAATSGFENVFKPAAEGGAEYRKAFGAALPYGTTMAAAAPLAAEAAKPPKGPEPSKSFIRPFSLDISNPSGTPQYTPQDTREREQVRYTFSPQPIYQAAQGGLAALNGQTYDDEYGRDEYEEGGSVKKRKSRSLKGDPYYAFADSRRNQSMESAIEQNFAKGGLPPRFLQGAGDGMSDSIKARIGGVQEARLADGEFVVPADVVSHLGNGSSKAGAKKLYAMMDKIRKARTGRTKQAPEVNPNKYMPA